MATVITQDVEDLRLLWLDWSDPRERGLYPNPTDTLTPHLNITRGGRAEQRQHLKRIRASAASAPTAVTLVPDNKHNVANG
jgi:hypothetical protein